MTVSIVDTWYRGWRRHASRTRRRMWGGREESVGIETGNAFSGGCASASRNTAGNVETHQCSSMSSSLRNPKSVMFLGSGFFPNEGEDSMATPSRFRK